MWYLLGGRQHRMIHPSVHTYTYIHTYTHTYHTYICTYTIIVSMLTSHMYIAQASVQHHIDHVTYRRRIAHRMMHRYLYTYNTLSYYSCNHKITKCCSQHSHLVYTTFSELNKKLGVVGGRKAAYERCTLHALLQPQVYTYQGVIQDFLLGKLF